MVLYEIRKVNYCFLNLRDAKPIILNAKMARVDGSGTSVVVQVNESSPIALGVPNQVTFLILALDIVPTPFVAADK